MRSHNCQFEPRDLLRLVACPLAVALAFGLLLHLAARLHILPPPWPILDMDRTIIVHAASSSLRPTAADTVLAGDSSCLMDVSAPLLSRMLGVRARSLATLSYLDLFAHARLVRNYAAANPGTLRQVILLLHPTTLRLSEVPGHHNGILDSFLSGKESAATGPGSLAACIKMCLGADIVGERVLGRVMPVPLKGAYGLRYGFTRDLWRSLESQAGSAVDPNRYDPKAGAGTGTGIAELRLAKRIERESIGFRQALPEGVRLVVGITPVPDSFAQPDHDIVCRSLLDRWGTWLQADLLLTNLPTRLEDRLFASIAHLNPNGARLFTTMVADELQVLRGQDRRSQRAIVLRSR